jgi:hypothetical protein
MKPITAVYSSYELTARDIRQKSIYDWCVTAFAGGDNSPRIRALRFGEESIELMQAAELTKADVHKLVSYVFARPVGEPHQEVGGVMLTLNAYCQSVGLKVVDAEMDEIARVNSKSVEHFQRRQQEKMEAGLS